MFAIATLPDMPREKFPEDKKKIAAATRLQPAVMAELERICADEDRTISYLIEKAVSEWLENRRKGKKR